MRSNSEKKQTRRIEKNAGFEIVGDRFPTLAADSSFFHLEARIHRAFQNLKIYVGVATTFVSGKCSFLLKAEGASTRLRASKLNNADIRSNKPAS